MGSRTSRRRFLARVSALLGAWWARWAVLFPRRAEAARPRARPAAASLTHGPALGHVATDAAAVWARLSAPGSYTLTCGPADGSGSVVRSEAVADPTNDLCTVWRLTGLAPGRRYAYEIGDGAEPILGGSGGFATATAPNVSAVVRLAVGSCAREDEGSAAVWRRMEALDPDAVVLLGDTPYIDTTELAVQRRRYAEFAAVADLASLVRERPLYATWDDHDFGLNDSDGNVPGKEDARRAFIEYHANPTYGDGSRGIYTSFRRGGVEVFLLDTRYFAGTEPSPVAPGQPTLLGAGQWEWLRRGLRASTAPFKLLASGMVWNGAVRPGKPDHWETYPHEREALFRFLGAERISGVVLVGGDIHRTRVLRHDTTSVVGYPLTELITSPMHGDVIEGANQPHPGLLHDSGEPHVFMLLTVDTTESPATLRAEFLTSAGRELYSLTLAADRLSA